MQYERTLSVYAFPDGRRTHLALIVRVRNGSHQVVGRRQGVLKGRTPVVAHHKPNRHGPAVWIRRAGAVGLAGTTGCVVPLIESTKSDREVCEMRFTASHLPSAIGSLIVQIFCSDQITRSSFFSLHAQTVIGLDSHFASI